MCGFLCGPGDMTDAGFATYVRQLSEERELTRSECAALCAQDAAGRDPADVGCCGLVTHTGGCCPSHCWGRWSWWC